MRHEHALRRQHLGDRDRVLVAAVVECPHEPRDLGRRPLEVEHRQRRRPRRAREHGALREVLRHGLQRARREAVDERAERLLAGQEAARVERDRRRVGVEREALLQQDAAGVGLALDHVPRDRVLALAAVDRPARRVEPRVARQRTVVEVDCEPPRQRQHRRRQHRQPGDREQQVERLALQLRRQVARGIEASQPLFGAVVAHLVGVGGHGDDVVPASAEGLEALEQQRVRADEHRGELG
ncbi:MAG: hypothetical protein U1E73_09165 [Planctomycetota bacterium]